MKLRDFLLAVTAIAVCVLSSSRAEAQQQIFLQITGVAGEATALGFEGSIDVLSASFAAANPACSKTGFTIGELVLTKRADKATTVLYGAMQSRTVYPAITIKFARTDGLVYQKYDLSNVMFSASAAAGGTGDPRNVESWNVSFSQAIVTYIYIDAKGGSSAPQTVTLVPSVCPGS